MDASEIKQYAYDTMKKSLEAYPKVTRKNPEHLLVLGYQSVILNFYTSDEIKINFNHDIKTEGLDPSTEVVMTMYVKDNVQKLVEEAYKEIKENFLNTP